MRTERSGDIVLGPHCQNVAPNRYLLNSNHAVLLISEPSGDFPVNLGAYSPDWSVPEGPLRMEFPQYIQQSLGFVTYFSSASLNDVSCVTVFEDYENGFCCGMLFEYISGGLRAVGQCRLGVDLSKKYISPSTICFRIRSWRNRAGRDRGGIQVDIGCCSVICHPQEEWNCRKFSNTLHFWFSEQRSILSIL